MGEINSDLENKLKKFVNLTDKGVSGIFTLVRKNE